MFALKATLSPLSDLEKTRLSIDARTRVAERSLQNTRSIPNDGRISLRRHDRIVHYEFDYRRDSNRDSDFCKMSQPKKKLMIAVHPDIYDFFQERATARGLTFQEYLREILG